MDAQDQPRGFSYNLQLSLLFVLVLLMSLCLILWCAQLVSSGEKQEWLGASMTSKLKADYRSDEWLEMHRFAPLRAEVIEQTARDEYALSVTPSTGPVPVAIAIVAITSTPFPPPGPTPVPVVTPQPSPTPRPSFTPQPSPTLRPTATSTLPPTGTATPSPTAPPTPTPTLPPPPTPTPTLPPTPAPTLPPTPAPTSPPPPPPTDTPAPPTATPTSPPPTPTPTAPAPIVYSITPDSGDTGSIVTITDLAGENFLPGATARIDNGIRSIDLISVTVISPTRITGTLDLSMTAGGPYDVQVTNPDLQSGVATGAFTVTLPITYSYPVTRTCSPAVADCDNVMGPPDNEAANINPGQVITLDFGPGNGIMDGQGYDFVFYEWDNSGYVYLDWIIIELSVDATTWYTAFYWGDGYNRPMDDYTNITSYSQNGEDDNEPIPRANLYPYPGTGTTVDIHFLAGPPEAQYRYVRLSCPTGGGDAAHVDAIQRLH